VKVVVYTAIFGNIDYVWSPFPLAMDAQHVCFTDRPRANQGLWTHKLTDDYPSIIGNTSGVMDANHRWEIRQVELSYSARRTARYYKCKPHLHFPEADVTVWVDGNVRLLVPARRAIKLWLKNDLATFTHHDRHCLYNEAKFCAAAGKGNRGQLQRQVKHYRKQGMPRNWGLPETKCIIRRNTEAMRKLNDMWFAEIERFSVRDQVSLPYVCWKLGIKWDVIPGRVGPPTFPGKKNPVFWFTKHKKRE
jgi:hypothetical protein